MSKEVGEPIAYKLGSIPFIHTEIFLDSRPLIPRTETEYWVDLAIKEIREKRIERVKILDLCAGSGCIGVAILKEIPDALVDFAEIDKSHHSTIEKNLRTNEIDMSRARIFGGDLFENISDTYNFILTNPPYIDPKLWSRVEDSVTQYEPREALDGGGEGLEIINRILLETHKYLKNGGVLYLEHEPEQVEALSKNPLYLNTSPDQYGVNRFSRFVK